MRKRKSQHGRIPKRKKVPNGDGKKILQMKQQKSASQWTVRPGARGCEANAEGD